MACSGVNVQLARVLFNSSWGVVRRFLDMPLETSTMLEQVIDNYEAELTEHCVSHYVAHLENIQYRITWPGKFEFYVCYTTM